MPEDTLAARLARVRAGITDACERSGRDPREVELVAVSKTVPPERMAEAYAAGARCFGENYVQEALGKADRLPRDIRWHFIGHLQSNKARRALELFCLVHSVDRPSLAAALDKAARAQDCILDVLIQVNLAGEETKSGTSAQGAAELLQRAGDWPNLRFGGLMTLPPYLDVEAVRPYFRELRELRDRFQDAGRGGPGFTHLSMGMSHDYRVAVEEGATLVRVGSAIFGERAL